MPKSHVLFGKKEVNLLKKVLINLSLVLIIFIIYFLQSNFFNWFTIAGVMPNLFVLFVLFVGLFANKFLGAIYGAIIGAVLDILFRDKIGINMIALGLVGVLATLFNKNFSKDSRITIMLMVSGLTIIYEVIVYFANYFVFSTSIEMWSFIRILIIEVIFNLFITIIIYPLFQKFGYYIENEFKGNRILTRYF